MHILILSFYYPPDLSAGSFRAQAMAHAILKEHPNVTEITILTTHPSRYRSYAPLADSIDANGALVIKRIKVRTTNSNLGGQPLLYLKFIKGVLNHTSKAEYDIVFATSSRLMTAALGAWVARKKKSVLFLDLRDLLTDTLPEFIPRGLRGFTKWFFQKIERWSVESALSVNLVSPGFAHYFKARYPNVPTTVNTNAIDNVFFNIDFHKHQDTAPALLKVLYAGNIGGGQGLHKIIPRLALSLRGRAEFTIVGCGNSSHLLKSELAKHHVSNVTIVSPVKRDVLLDYYRTADILFLHLNSHPSLQKVIPSKLFEYAATGKPIWAGMSGFSAEFTLQIPNTALFEPCNVESALQSLPAITLGPTDRRHFIEKYSRDKIASKMAKEIMTEFYSTSR